MNKTKLLTICLAGLVLLSGCQTGPLNYQINPDLSPVTSIKSDIKILSVAVIDKRNQSAQNTKISSKQPLAETLLSQLKKQVTTSGFKLIANPLLADMAFTLEIEDFTVSQQTATFSSNLKVRSQINLKLQKKSQTLSKRFVSTREQEVALPVKDTDVTGIVNQTLSEQLANAFSDAAVSSFIEQPASAF